MEDKGDKKCSVTRIFKERKKIIELKNYLKVELEKTIETNESTE